MVWNLVRDLFRRSREEYAIGLVFLTLVWLYTERGQASRSVAMAITLCGAAFLGPMLAFSRLAPKEVLLLPVSRRQVWLARWVGAAVLPVACAFSAQSLAVGLMWLGQDGPLDPGAVALTAVCVFTYTSALMSLLPLSELARRIAVLRRVRSVQFTVHAVVVVLFGGGAIWPVLLSDRLPTGWQDLSGGVGIALLAAGAVAITGLSYRPAVRAHAASLALAPAVSQEVRWAPVLDDRFTGLPKLLWLDATRTAAAIALMLLIVAGGFVAMDLGMGEARSVGASLVDVGVLPFDSGIRAVVMALALGTVAMTLRDRDPGTGLNLFRSSLRFWRTLPLSRDALIALLVVRRLVGWTMLWAMLLALQVAFVGAPASLRLDLLAYCAGLDALAFATALRWRKSTLPMVPMTIVLLATLPIAVMLREAGTPEAAVLLGAGLSALGLALFVHRGALARSETYLSVGAARRAMSGDMATEG